ncbi:MAG: SAM-dependent methyltransferase [Sediminibacterium sp.]|nr:SAM-dependent methyltransferase [Sediminibacterium sp.]TXT29586.1 MAG: O-methyltransferase-like protein [Chitinophagaceae bacterium]
MARSLLQVLKYVQYYFTASNAKGHGIHSPFVFELVTKVLNDDRQFYSFEPIESLRKQIIRQNKKSKSGALSRMMLPKYDQLLFKLVHFWSPDLIVHLGSSILLNVPYLASANLNTPLYALEPSLTNAELANAQFIQLGLNNIQLIPGSLSNNLPDVLGKITKLDLALVNVELNSDGLITLFEQLVEKAHPGSMIVLSHIHLNAEMERAWEQIKLHEAVTLTLDLFHLGLVFFRKENIIKENFIIRF